jgi:spermidine/putrescine transport system ATP-binding protein
VSEIAQLPPLVQLIDISRRYGDKTVLDHASLDIAQGEFTVLLGPSGSGKTTLLNILGGFLDPSEGRVLIGGHDVTRKPPAKRPTATVFQDYALFPHMTVGANVGFGLRMRGVGYAKRVKRAKEALEMVGLADAFHRKPHELSGGQRQRVALARSLVVEPQVLLLDEPLGALDLKLRRQMQEELKALQRRVGTTFVHVTHDQEEALAIADRIVVMNNGRIEDQGTPERVYLRPASRFAALFMGDSNIIEGRALASIAGATRIETPFGTFEVPGIAGGNIGAAVSLRPEHIVVGGMTPPGWHCLRDVELTELTFLGTYARARLAPRAGPSLVASVPQNLPHRTGDIVRISFDPVRLVLLIT